MSHHHSHHAVGHSTPDPTPGRRLFLALALTLVFALVEALGGFWSGSLALLGDAGHMFSDATALGIALLAAWLAQRPPSVRHTYGFARAEVLAALINGLIMLAVVTVITVEAIARLQAPKPVAGMPVMAIAATGLIVNAMVLAVLSRGTHDLNTRGAMLHVFGDLLGSVAALVSGAVIYYTGWIPIDPLLSLAIVGLILISTFRLLREALHVLMEGVPTHIDLQAVARDLVKVEGVRSVHDLHIWTAVAGTPALSAHVVVDDLSGWEQTLVQLRSMLRDVHAIEHVTLQPETGRRGPETVSFVQRDRLPRHHR